MTIGTGTQTIAINILTNILGSKKNQTFKFGPLIEHNVKNIFRKIFYKV